MTTTELDPIIVHTIRDVHTMACPICEFTIDVPDVPVSNALGNVFGMSGQTLALVHAEQEAKRSSRQMVDHLQAHTALESLERLAIDSGRIHCQVCQRPRTPIDGDYNPLQVIGGKGIGWYSAEGDEICGGCMTGMINGGGQ